MRSIEGAGILSESTLAIIGGTGKMGRSLVQLLKPSGPRVLICSRDIKKAEDFAKRFGTDYCSFEEAAKADIIIVSTPTDKVVPVSLQVLEGAKTNSLLIDVSSVKTGITNTILKRVPRNMEYLSIHPLFGPHIRRFEGENVLYVSAKPGTRSKVFLAYLTQIGLNVTEVGIHEHDKIMAVIQVMHHYGLLCLGVSLMAYLPSDTGRRFYTALLRRSLNHLDSVTDNLSAVTDVQERNPYAEWARSKFVECAQSLQNLSSEDVTKIRDSFRKVHTLTRES